MGAGAIAQILGSVVAGKPMFKVLD